MKLYVPDYYGKFKCIAQKCKHNCCIGWEIDIDSQSLEKYKSIGGTLGKRLAENICTDTDCPHFILGIDERCPFLDKDNLCDIIKELGDEGLCNICNEHPRFANEFIRPDGTLSRIEKGLGLCCEQAVRIVLESPAPFSLETPDGEYEEFCTTDAERAFLTERQSIINILENTSDIDCGFDTLCRKYGIFLPDCTSQDTADFYLSLERLDESWTQLLEGYRKKCKALKIEPLSLKHNDMLCRLAVYFIFRHLAHTYVIYGEDELSHNFEFLTRLAFCIHATQFIYFLWQSTLTDSNANPEEYLFEIVRMYSSEIEYSPENTECVLDMLCEFLD